MSDCAGIIDAGHVGLSGGAMVRLYEGNERVLAALRPGCRAVLETDRPWPARKHHDTLDAGLDAAARGARARDGSLRDGDGAAGMKRVRGPARRAAGQRPRAQAATGSGETTP